jgi:hypothetical protein
MHAIWLGLSPYGPVLLTSSAIIAAGTLVAWLSNVAQTTHGHVCRVGLKPVRVAVGPSRGTTVLSVRTLDQHHVWIRSAGGAAPQIEGDEAH